MTPDSHPPPAPIAARAPARGGVRPLDWAQAAGAEEIVERAMWAGVRRRRQRRLIGAGAVTALALLLGGLTWRTLTGAPAADSLSAAAFVTTPERRVLPDGSVVELKGAAEIAVDFGGALRRVELRRGEAHFQVAKNPARPFVVSARGVEVRAVGTAFSVGVETANVEVLVTEGRVAVATAGPVSPAAEHLFLDAGQRVSVEAEATASPAVQSVSSAEAAERLAWREPRLELQFTPLSAVLPLVNAHAATRVTLADPALGELKLSGSLRAGNVPVLLQILETSYGVRAEPAVDGTIVLRRAP